MIIISTQFVYDQLQRIQLGLLLLARVYQQQVPRESRVDPATDGIGGWCVMAAVDLS